MPITYSMTAVVHSLQDKKRLNRQKKKIAIARPVSVNGVDVHRWVIFSASDAVHDEVVFCWTETYGFCKSHSATEGSAYVRERDSSFFVDKEKIYSYQLDRSFVRTTENNPSAGSGTFCVRNDAIDDIGLGLTMAHHVVDGDSIMNPIAILPCDKGDTISIKPKEQMAIFTLYEGQNASSFYTVQGDETIVTLNPSETNIEVSYEDGKWVQQ